MSGFLGHTLVIWSHGHVESWRSALVTQCVPVMAVILTWIVLVSGSRRSS